MKISVSKLSETRVKLTVSLDKSELDDGQKVALVKLARGLKVAGFRKGKVPPSVAAKHIDASQLAVETADNAISQTLPTAFESEQLRALSRPEVEVTKFEPGEALEYTAEADILPEVKLGNYKKLKAPKQEKVTISKSEIDEVIGRIKTQMASKKSVKRAAADGDVVVIDFVGKKDDVAFDGGTAKDYELTLGSNSFIPGFESGIVGHKVGDSFALDLVFPKDYGVSKLAGANVTFDVTLTDVKEMKLPDETDEWAAKVGPYTTVQDLRQDIKRELTAQAEATRTEQLRDDLVKQLVEKSDAPVPLSLREDHLKSIEQDLTQNLAYQGKTFEQWLTENNYESREDWIDKEAAAVADERVKTGLVLSELSKVEEISATNDDVTSRVEAMKQQYASQPHMLEQLSDPEALRSIANRILTEKTIERLLELNMK